MIYEKEGYFELITCKIIRWKLQSTENHLLINEFPLNFPEKKLQKIQKKPTVSSSAEKRDLLLSLTGAREGHINRLLNKPIGDIIPYEEDCDQTIDNPLTTTLVRHIAPHLQAVNTVELVELLKADRLEITNSEDTVQLENLFNSKIQ